MITKFFNHHLPLTFLCIFAFSHLATAESVAPIQVSVASNGKFTPINPMIDLGTGPIVGGTSKQFSLPSEVPASAKEVLVYAVTRTGSVSPNASYYFHIYTKDGATKYGKYLYGSSYAQNAVSYNSGNFWLPITADRLVNITLGGTTADLSAGNNLNTTLSVIGYR